MFNFEGSRWVCAACDLDWEQCLLCEPVFNEEAYLTWSANWPTTALAYADFQSGVFSGDMDLLLERVRQTAAGDIEPEAEMSEGLWRIWHEDFLVFECELRGGEDSGVPVEERVSWLPFDPANPHQPDWTEFVDEDQVPF